ncbi:MAG: 50S ribosomal protein L3 N(5)-glutamine methyltransferase, partial [Pseudomonadota bacterium]
DNAGDEAHALVMLTLSLPFEVPAYVYAAALTAPERDRLAKRLHRRIHDRVPLPYVTGQAFFCGLPFSVDPRVLIPRSPIAELIESRFDPYVALPEGARVLDMCTGGGCLAIAAAVWHPDITVDAVDIDSGALAVARDNVARHDVADRVNLVQSDGFGAVPKDRRYDLIIANPPYVPTSSMATLPAEYTHEPSLALEAGSDGLDLARQLMREAPSFLAPDGALLMEVGEAAAALIEDTGPLPLVWCEFERGGDGVFVVDAASLNAARAT